MRFTLLVTTLALAGCEKDLLANLPDAAPDASGCSTPDQPLAAGNFTVYFNTEGVTLHRIRAGEYSDSRTNRTDIIAVTDAVVPPFLSGVAGREAFIDEIVVKARSVVAPYSIDIVTTRPASGNYNMFVLGGDSSTIGGCTDCAGTGNYRGCGQQLLNPNQISIWFDFGADEPGISAFYTSSLLGEIGLWGDLVPTTVMDDCMCRFDAPCVTRTPGVVCTFGSNVPTTMAIDPDGNPYNCNISPQDEPARLKAAYGCR